MKLTLQIIAIIILVSSCDNANYQIHQICDECKNTHIPNTPYVLATNPDGDYSNIYHKDREEFLFENWFHIYYDASAFGKEIAFNTNGRNFSYSLTDLETLTNNKIFEAAGLNEAAPEPSVNSDLTISKLASNIYSNSENGFETFLSFKKNYSETTGVMTLSQSQCKYVYNVDISGQLITAIFFRSTCGATADNTTLNYDREHNNITIRINGQKFVFESEF